MRIAFLGTSNANPRQGRGQACIAIEAGGLGHIIDCGDGASTKLYLDPEISWENLRGLLITHLHPDHAAGLFVLLHLLHMMAEDCPDWPIRNGETFKLCLPECAGSHAVAAVLPAFHIGPDRFSFAFEAVYYETRMAFSVGALRVTPWKTSHCEEAHGFTIEAEGKRIVVSGDLGRPAELAEHARGADVVVMECAHFHPSDLAAALEGTGARRYVLTHLHNRILDRFGELEHLFDPIRKEGELLLAEDGLAIELGS